MRFSGERRGRYRVAQTVDKHTLQQLINRQSEPVTFEEYAAVKSSVWNSFVLVNVISSFPTNTIATSVVHSKLDCCNSLYFNRPILHSSLQ